MDRWIAVLSLLCILAAALVVFLDRRRTRKTLDTIGAMLDNAMDGRFSEKRFDETRLSALETKFAHYLSASSLSARNVAAQKKKVEALISDISHQTKTPIATLLLYGDLLAESELTVEQRANVEAIRAQGEKLRFLIDSLVKLSRLEAGILTFSPREQAVEPMLKQVLQQYAAKAREKGLALQAGATGAVAVFDSKWTAEALGNLVDNAIKYTPSGSVTLTAREYELFTRIDVADTGIGIPEAEQPRVFARFYRGGDVREAEGVGVGLHLARQIVCGQGGYIKLKSQVGAGATFSVFLPREILQNR